MLEAINELIPGAHNHLEDVFALAHEWYLRGADLWRQFPGILRQAVMLALFLAVLGTVTSLIKAVSNNYKEWKPMPDSKLMFGYFCGSGDHQRRLIHKNAKTLVVDRTWPWISVAGIAYRAWCKILCKRYSTKPRMALRNRADWWLKPLSTNGSDGRGGMRAACGVNAAMAV